MSYRIYLDNCCFNRPYDNQTYPIIQLESEAKLFVQQEILRGKLELVWSFILEYENSVNPYINRKKAIVTWRKVACLTVAVSDKIYELTEQIMATGIKKKDALHLACAIQAKCDFFLTTDKRLLNSRIENITILNPLDFIKRWEV
ncbi:MAG: PIN domain-containing protein [Planctomycetaceae bacterium]|jgi:predicted nucleic acid-binding protein|nr:PIN domain-containing protein [Planctomycetaceae bacterium]